jgi:aldehyde dehydrogenase (NAD+)
MATTQGDQFIDGKWRRSASTARIVDINPTTEGEILTVPAGDPDDAIAAVAAARHAFGPWSRTLPVDRARVLERIATAISLRENEFADVICEDVGTPLHLVAGAHIANAIGSLTSSVELGSSYPWEEEVGSATVVRAPAGVVVAITPWNFPLSMALEKVAPALLAGCTVILKPSEVAPLSSYLLAEVFQSEDVPPGVFNFVMGRGDIVGETLVKHPDVDMVSFTGSTRAGTHILGLCAGAARRSLVEMGGKSANIVLADADLDRAVPNSVQACFFNSGQACASLSRLLVPDTLYDEIVERVEAVTARLTIGDPRSGVDLGPLISDSQRAMVRSYIDRGVAEGARLVTGGVAPPDALEHGFFVRPTVLADVDNNMVVAREEVFGPVLSILKYRDDEEAIAIANDSPYGLSGAIWATDIERAEAVARQLRTGSVRINGERLAREAPFGGFKLSGIGRSRGRFGVDEYVELQSITKP